MLTFRGRKGVAFCDGLTRRDFLRVGTLSAGSLGLTLADLSAAGGKSTPRNCIILFLVGGPSHLDTWDLKPEAPAEIRGPFRSMRTSVPGIHISEHFPRMAAMAERYAIVRSVYHKESPIHETGHQLLQTGRLCTHSVEYPSVGAVVDQLLARRQDGVPASVVLPAPIGNTGVTLSHGQGAGYLGAAHAPLVACDLLPTEAASAVREVDPARLEAPEDLVAAVDGVHQEFDRLPQGNAHLAAQLFAPAVKRAFVLDRERDDLRGRYGLSTFGQSCLLARRLVESGVRLVTVNMFDTVFNEVTWDCHADGGSLAGTLEDYKTILCPMFDRAYCSLLEDLHQRGLLESTLVVAMGEFGRTPYLNHRGGRDHWPNVWSILLAGGGVKGGQVIGASDRHGMEPAARPVHASEVVASIYHSLGIDTGKYVAGPDGRPLKLVEAEPIWELFAE
jgi:hypothetical protein